MKISVDGGALNPKNNQRFGTSVFSENLFKALQLYDKKNQYKIYTFDNLKPRLFWLKGRISLEEFKQKNNIFLIGDAACHVKATTGGGIIPSLKAAHTLCDCILSKKDYGKEFKKQSGRELLLHLRIRNALNKFSDKDYGYLLSLMNQEKVKKILKKYDRDTPMPLVLNLLLREPRFLSFAKYIF